MEKKTEKEEKYMKELQDRYIRFDWAIKRLLRQKANFGVLEGFLTVFLGEQIKIEEILESEGNQQMADDKFNRVDIKAKNKGPKSCGIRGKYRGMPGFLWEKWRKALALPGKIPYNG